MRQLSAQQAGWLYADSPQANANVSLLLIYDQGTAPGGVVRFKSILAHIGGRLPQAALLRQRLQRVPLALDHPYWVDDQNFDLEYHLRHIALPKPGDWRQFCIQASRIHARALDLDRPLWEAYVIEGLDSFLDLPAGSFALLFKTHLAALPLHQLGALTTLLHDAQAEPPAPAPPAPWFADAPPGRLALLARGLKQSATAPLRLVRPLAQVAMQAAPAAAALAREMLLHPATLPPTRFNSVLSPHRVFETRRFASAEFEAIRTLVPGATLDDAVLAVCGGALRRYLGAQGELPAGHSLTALLPVLPGPGPAIGPRHAGDADLAWRHVRLGTQIADAQARLAAIQAQADEAPDPVARIGGGQALAQAGEQASATLLAWSRRLARQAGARLGQRTPPAHCTITLLPAPAGPLYLCGARLSYCSAMLPISDGLGLSLAVSHFDGRVLISATSCRELMPDPEVFAQCLRDSFQEYLALTLPRPTAARPGASAGGRKRPAARPG